MVRIQRWRKYAHAFDMLLLRHLLRLRIKSDVILCPVPFSLFILHACIMKIIPSLEIVKSKVQLPTIMLKQWPLLLSIYIQPTTFCIKLLLFLNCKLIVTNWLGMWKDSKHNTCVCTWFSAYLTFYIALYWTVD